MSTYNKRSLLRVFGLVVLGSVLKAVQLMELSRQVQVAMFWCVASFKIKHLDLSWLCAYSHSLFFLENLAVLMSQSVPCAFLHDTCRKYNLMLVLYTLQYHNLHFSAVATPANYWIVCVCTKLDYALKGELTTDFSCSVCVALVWQNVPHLLMFQRTFCELQWKEILSFAQMSSHDQYHTFF